MIVGVILFIICAFAMAGLHDFLAPIIGEEDARGITMMMTAIPAIPVGIFLGLWWCLERVSKYYFSPIESPPINLSRFESVKFSPSRFQKYMYSPEGLQRLEDRKLREWAENRKRGI